MLRATLQISGFLILVLFSSALIGCFHVQISGSVAGATVSFTPLDDPDDVLAVVESWDVAEVQELVSQENWDAFGLFQRLIVLGVLSRPDYPFETDRLYLLTAAGGYDYDTDYDLLMDEVPEEVLGEWHAIMSGRHLQTNAHNVSALTELVYQLVKDELPGLSAGEAEALLDAMASRLVLDFNGDCTIDYTDVLRWSNIFFWEWYRGEVDDLDEFAFLLLDGAGDASRLALAQSMHDALFPMAALECGEWVSSGGQEPLAQGNATYLLEILADTIVSVELYAAVDSYLYLLDESFNVIAENDDRDEFRHQALIEISLTAGTYYVVAATYEPGLPGPFQLGVAAPGGSTMLNLDSITSSGFDNASLSGRVVDQNNNPVVAATLKVTGLNTAVGQANVTLFTDSNGDYSLRIDAARVVGGAFTVSVTADGCEDAGPSIGALDGNRHATIDFHLQCEVADAAMLVGLGGSGEGTVESSDGEIDCPGDCSQVYRLGTRVTLTALPAPGSEFTGWSGACSGTGSCTLTLQKDAATTANFEEIPPEEPDDGPTIEITSYRCTDWFGQGILEATGRACGPPGTTINLAPGLSVNTVYTCPEWGGASSCSRGSSSPECTTWVMDLNPTTGPPLVAQAWAPGYSTASVTLNASCQ